MSLNRIFNMPWLYVVVVALATVILFSRGTLELGPLTLPLGDFVWGIVGGAACAIGCLLRRRFIGAGFGVAWAVGWYMADGGKIDLPPEWAPVIGAVAGLAVAILGVMTICNVGPLAKRTRASDPSAG